MHNVILTCKISVLVPDDMFSEEDWENIDSDSPVERATDKVYDWLSDELMGLEQKYYALGPNIGTLEIRHNP